MYLWLIELNFLSRTPKCSIQSPNKATVFKIYDVMNKSKDFAA